MHDAYIVELITEAGYSPFSPMFDDRSLAEQKAAVIKQSFQDYDGFVAVRIVTVKLRSPVKS